MSRIRSLYKGAIIPFAALAIVSCRSRGDVCILPEPETRQVETVSCNIDILNPWKLFVAEERLMVYQDMAERPFIVFPLPLNGNGYVAGYRGRGSGELIDPDIKSFVGNLSGFSVVDRDGSFRTYSFDSGGDLELSDEVMIKGMEGPMNGVLRLSSSAIKFVYVRFCK